MSPRRRRLAFGSAPVASSSTSQAEPAAEAAPRPAGARDSRRRGAPSFGAAQLGVGIRLALPAALILYTAFNAGGFFAGTQGRVAFALCLVLVGVVTLARRPLAAVGPYNGVAIGGLVAYGLWQLLSSDWSHASARALLSFDLTLVYLLVVTVSASVARTRLRLRLAMTWIAGAMSLVCGFALVSRVLPHVIPTHSVLVPERLSYPLTYWNGMGIFAALAAIATLHVASDAGVPRLVRAGAAGALPVIVPTLYLTLSRGGLAAAVVGVALYVLLAARWSLLGTFVVAGVPTALATLSAYNATALVTVHPRSPLAVHQGHGVARTVAIMIAIAFVAQLAIAFTPVDTRLPAVPRGARMPARVIAVVVAVVVGVAAGGPHFVSTKFHGFVHGNHIHTSADVRERLFNPANNGRLPLWRSALAAYRAAPVHGQGAGTFETWWHRHRKITDEAVHAHSIYLGSLAELGFVGLALIVIALGALLAGVAMRLRARGSPLHAAALSLLVMWLLHAALDWDWEMPAVTIPVLALAAFCAARSPRSARAREWPNLMRVLVGIALLIVAVTPARIALSQSRLDAALTAFRAGDCTRAIDRSLSSISVLSPRPEPFEIMGFCDARLGQPAAAQAALRAAIARDRLDWDYWYGLALVRGAAGQDPRPAARRALELNRMSRVTRAAVRGFRGNDPRRWAAFADRAPLPLP